MTMTMPPPPSAAAVLRGILATPLERVLLELDERRGGRGPGHQRVVTLNHDTSVAAALHTLSKHRILSAPVVIQPDPLDSGA
jgi:hypothetical protein